MVTIFPNVNRCWPGGMDTVLMKEATRFVRKIPNLRYSIFQLEAGEESDSVHLQMYVELSKSVRLTRF